MSSTKVKENVMTMTLTQNSVRKAVKSHTMSKRYINTMLRATVINILYHRLNIDEREFITKAFNHISFKIFRSKSKNALVREFHSYMMACKDALEKNYLREFYLYFVDPNSGDIVETYKFTFKYSEKDQRIPTQDEEDLVECTTTLLKNLEDFHVHSKFSSDIELRVELTYFDDTPDDYEPPGFKGINESDSLMKKLGKNNSVVLGSLFTGFHRLRCSAKGGVFNLDCSQGSNSSKINCEDVQNNRENGDFFEAVNNRSPPIYGESQLITEDFSVPISQPIAEITGKLNETYISQCVEVSSDSDGEVSSIISDDVNCPCKLPRSVQSWTPYVVQCVACNRKCHAPCQGYINETFLGPTFRCGDCRESQEVGSESSTRFSLTTNFCRVRYLVACVYTTSTVPSKLEEAFKETIKKIRIFQKDGNITKFSRTALDMLFDFTYKEPDLLERTFNFEELPIN